MVELVSGSAIFCALIIVCWMLDYNDKLNDENDN